MPVYEVFYQRKGGDGSMPKMMVKEQAHKLIDQMPDQATWDDLMRQIYVREIIEQGLADSKAGHTKDLQTLRAKYSLPE